MDIPRGDPGRAVVLNATTINKGGGIQAVVAFIRLAIEQGSGDDGIRWRFAVSGQVRDQLATFGHELRDGLDLCLERSPARHRASRARLREFADLHADLVFTFFGPAYVRFRCPHLCGVADGWVTHSDRLAFATIPTFGGRLRMAATCAYKAFWFRRASHWVVEQESARAGLVRRLRLPADRIFIVSNNCSQAYIEAGPGPQRNDPQRVFRILTFAANFPNKCLALIPAVAAELAGRRGIGNVQFVVTLPPEEYAASTIAAQAAALDVAQYVDNVGYVALQDGPALYRSCDIVFMPTVLETFSATYPEAMQMGLPIVTSDLGFARSICGNAAAYFSPRDPVSAAGQLARLIQDRNLRESLVADGYSRARTFPTPAEKYAHYRRILDRIMTRAAPHATP